MRSGLQKEICGLPFPLIDNESNKQNSAEKKNREGEAGEERVKQHGSEVQAPERRRCQQINAPVSHTVVRSEFSKNERRPLRIVLSDSLVGWQWEKLDWCCRMVTENANE